MKILVISNIFPPGFIGGYELGAFDVASSLSQRGHDVHVLTSDYFLDEDDFISNFTVERSLECTLISHERGRGEPEHRKGWFINMRNIRLLRSKIVSQKPDLLLIFNSAGLGPIGLYQYLYALRYPTISYYMDHVFLGGQNDVDKWTRYARVFGPLKTEAVGSIISMSRNLMREMSAVLPGCEGLATYVPGWVDGASVGSSFSDGSGTRQETSVRKFVFCSRVAAHKGTGLLIDAVANLKARGLSNFEVDIFGAGQVTQFLAQVSRAGLADIIRYKGSLPKQEMLRAFKSYDALLFPTWPREAFGFVVGEAAAAGCVPIMTSSIGAAEWFIDGQDCVKIDHSAESLAQAMRAIIEMSSSRLNQFQETSIDNARRYLSFERWIGVIEKKCVEIGRGPSPNLAKNAAQIEAAFLTLADHWRETGY